MSALKRVECPRLRVEVTPTSIAGLVNAISESIDEKKDTLIVGHNLHSVYLYHTHPRFRSIYDAASIILSDGAPVHWDQQSSRSRVASARIGSTDWIPHLHKVGNLRRIFVLGASREANVRFIELLSQAIPHAQVDGMSGENWNKHKSESAIARVKSARPQLLLVGLGMPRQEYFVQSVIDSRLPTVIATVGGAIDQMTGVQRNAPRWLGSIGLEWLWRLASQPSRLAHRYLIEPWKLIALLRRASRRERTDC